MSKVRFPSRRVSESLADPRFAEEAPAAPAPKAAPKARAPRGRAAAARAAEVEEVAVEAGAYSPLAPRPKLTLLRSSKLSHPSQRGARPRRRRSRSSWSPKKVSRAATLPHASRTDSSSPRSCRRRRGGRRREEEARTQEACHEGRSRRSRGRGLFRTRTRRGGRPRQGYSRKACSPSRFASCEHRCGGQACWTREGQGSGSCRTQGERRRGRPYAGTPRSPLI